MIGTQTIIAGVGVLFLGAIFLWVHLGNRAERARNRRRAEEWRAANPPGPALTPKERQAFDQWVEAETLPAIFLTPGGTPARENGTRIGGPAWLPESEQWPQDGDGRPMEFLAQIDFGELPAIPDFPEAGLLQFFISQGDLFGADFDVPDRCDIRLFWYPEPRAGRLVSPPPLDPKTSMTPLEKSARTNGASLTGTAGTMPPTVLDWRVDAKIGMREGADALIDALGERSDAYYGVHQVGGHPVYTQWDFRSADRFADYDRTLLHLTSDNGLMWGDVGEAAFLVRREDLLARRFDRVIFWWDCT